MQVTGNKDLQRYNGVMQYGFDLKDSLVFDVGLNLGSKSATLLAMGAKVVGFEPQEDCFYGALNRLSVQKSIGIFDCKNIALSNHVGRATLYKSQQHVLSSMSTEFIRESEKQRFKGNQWNQKIEVVTSTLDDEIIEFGQPKYIKIDVEGYELQVLEGLTSPVEYISIEFTPELFSNSKKCLEYLHTLNSGDCEYNYVYRENDHYLFDTWQTFDQILNYLSNVNDFVYEFGDIYIKSVLK